MEVVLKFFQGFINMGASTLLPFVIAILGIFFGMRIGRAIKAGLLVGIGFQGLVLAVNLLITSVTPAMQYYKDLGSGYDTLEIGFAALGAASWTTPFAVLVIPAIIIANLILVRLKVTKVLNVDIWNFMHFLVPGALAYALTKNAVIGFIVAFACGKADENRNKNFEGGRPSSIIIGNQLNPKTLGALLAHFENKIMFQGFLWNVNSFDQEGVQLGKVLAKRVLAHETDGALKAFSDLLNI